MSISQPSHEVYVVDVPEVKDLSAAFRYNFFVPDESVNETGGVPAKILLRPSGEIDAEFTQYASLRAPRFVVFSFTPPRISDVGREVTSADSRQNVFDKPLPENLIASNLDKIVTEDDFASYDFISVGFHDGELSDKVHYLVSGSFEQHTLEDETSSDVSHIKAANRLADLVPDHIKPHFLTRAMTSPEKSVGASFFSTSDSRSGKASTSSSTRFRTVRNLTSTQGRDKSKKASTYFARMGHVMVHAQINGKLFHDIIDRTIQDPHSPFSADLQNLHEFSKQVQASSKQRFTLQVTEQDYKTIVPYVGLQVSRAAYRTDRQAVELVGFIIDKSEITRTGQVVDHPPIVIENPRSNTTLDFRLKYGSRYSYTIRTIARFTLPAIDDDTGDVATMQILVSSRPSNKVYIKAHEDVPPPPPTDLNFTWDYENDKLLIHWTFPPNSQRDIKKFQVFRRASIDHSFELIKMYDFDDSVIKHANVERPDPHLVEYLTSPAAFYVDDDFDRTKSRYIYAVASIDAHGMVSNYSAQYELRFDPFKNALQKKLISHTGAPKPYPNLYLEADTFVDTIRVEGPHSKRMLLVFNPEYYHLIDDDERVTDVVATQQQQGEYKLQLINLDNQRSQTLTITIDDQTMPANKQAIFTDKQMGKAVPLLKK